MESVISASKAGLVSALDFGSQPGVIADYIQSRNQIQVFPSGSNTFSPAGVKQMRFSIGSAGGAFLDMSTLAVQARFTN